MPRRRGGLTRRPSVIAASAIAAVPSKQTMQRALGEAADADAGADGDVAGADGDGGGQPPALPPCSLCGPGSDCGEGCVGRGMAAPPPAAGRSRPEPEPEPEPPQIAAGLPGMGTGTNAIFSIARTRGRASYWAEKRLAFEIEEFLHDVPLLKKMKEFERKRLVPFLKPVTFELGAVIMAQGDDADAMYFLKHGEAVASIAGKGEVRRYAAGEYFGELALLMDSTRSATITAAGDSSEGVTCYRLNKDHFRDVPKYVRLSFMKHAAEMYVHGAGTAAPKSPKDKRAANSCDDDSDVDSDASASDSDSDSDEDEDDDEDENGLKEYLRVRVLSGGKIKPVSQRHLSSDSSESSEDEDGGAGASRGVDAPQIQALVISGLGSGRVELLRHVLNTLPDGARAAVCVHRCANGLAAPQPPLSHPTICQHSEVRDFGSGSGCCQVGVGEGDEGGELARQLRVLAQQRRGGGEEQLTHLLIETSGFADPAHFTQLFQQPADGAPSTEAQLRREICSAFRLRGVVTVVAEQDMASLQPGHMLQRRGLAQLAAADSIVLLGNPDGSGGEDPGDGEPELDVASDRLTKQRSVLTQAEQQIHVRGIGADGWDGTEGGVGRFENEAALQEIFGAFGTFVQATIRHRIEDGQNTSWALVTMGDVESVDRALAAPSVMAGTGKLVLNRYSKKQAAASTGAMVQVQKEAGLGAVESLRHILWVSSIPAASQIPLHNHLLDWADLDDLMLQNRATKRPSATSMRSLPSSRDLEEQHQRAVAATFETVAALQTALGKVPAAASPKPLRGMSTDSDAASVGSLAL